VDFLVSLGLVDFQSRALVTGHDALRRLSMVRARLLSLLYKNLPVALLIAHSGLAVAECPPVLSEAPSLGDPPHSAQVMYERQPACPEVNKVSAVLYSDDTKVSSRSFFEESLAEPPLRLPVRDALSLPDVAGLYRIDWLTEFSNGETQNYTQTFVIPCPAPEPVAAYWNDADSTLLLEAPAGDTCQGETNARLSLKQLTGEPVPGVFSTAYRADGGVPVQQSLEVRGLEGERRYVGTLVLSNASELETEVPVEFVTGCGGLVPTATILGSRMVGAVTASQCQFPINLKVTVTHHSGEQIQSVDALLMDDEFDFELPDFDAWPAGDYVIETRFIGAAARARHTNTLSIACSDPEFSAPTLELDSASGQAEVVFTLQGRDYCQNQTRVSLQVRDSANVVAFNRTVDLDPDSRNEQFRWPFQGIPGSNYELRLSANYGVQQQTLLEKTAQSVYECTAPEVLNFGYANPNANHLGALVALTSCNAPATAKLIVQNASGRVVVDAEPQIVQDVGTAYARISPVSLGHLDSGDYEATLLIADNRSRSAEKTISLSRDIDGPQITFNHEGEQLETGEIPTLGALNELSLSFLDSNAPMDRFRSIDAIPDPYGASAEAAIERVEGEATPQMWITGVLDLPRDAAHLGLVGVLVRAPGGEHWLAPIARRYVPGTRSELQDFHPSRYRTGFRAVARIQPLSPNRYEILGVIVADPTGVEHLVVGGGNFTVSSLAAQQPDAILRQGVSEIPIALDWSSDNTARLSRITSVPDGDYTLSAIGRDVFGNASSVHSIVLRLNQAKRSAALRWPSIAGYKKTFQHRFRIDGSQSRAPLRVLYRRVDGYGDVRINRRNITEQTSEDVISPDADGAFTIEVELLDADVDARFVLHADGTDALPLELSITTFLPEFVTQRKRSQTSDVLSIKHTQQECRQVVFDDLARVSLHANEVLCAVRLNIPGTSVISSGNEQTDVRLPPGVSTNALYEEGFIRVSNGLPTFASTRQIAVKDMQSYSSTPQVEFVPLNDWKSRARSGSYITGVGDTVAGHFVIRAGLGQPLVYVDGESVAVPSRSAGSIRLPVRTSTQSLGDVDTVTVRAHYPDTPELFAEKRFEFTAAPERVFVEATKGQFVTPGELQMTLEIRDGSGPVRTDHHGAYEIVAAEVRSRHDDDSVLVSPSTTLKNANLIQTDFGALKPGVYRLQLTLANTDPRFAQSLAHIKTDTSFEVLDGSPVPARLFTFRQSDKTPFFGQLSIDYPDPVRRRDVSRVAWQVSTDGQAFQPWQCCGHSADFALSDPGALYYRAEITNRHSEAVSYTDAMRIDAYLSGQLEVLGPRHTFRGYPATYTVAGLPEGYDVLWRMTAPNADRPIEQRSSEFTIPADETGIYVVEVVADTATENPDARSALRTFFTLDCSWPRIPESVISGPTQVEYGKSSTFTVTHPPIFKNRGNPDVKRVGEWELPDGSRVQDDEWAQFTLREMPEGFAAVDVLYHTWLQDDPTTLTTAVHRIEPVSYRWPNWQLKVATNSLEPPAILRLSVSPEDWREWMGLGDSPITTHWEVPDHVRILDRTPTEAIVYAVDDREFGVVARITDPRGNVTELQKQGVRPLKQIPFEISLSVVAERTLHTAPIEITAQVDPIVLPKNRAISRVAFYVDGLYRGVSDGAPIKLQIRTPGDHEIKAIASIDSEFTSSDAVSLMIAENHQAICSIIPVGDFRLNGLAKAKCDDPDGHMVEYRWYSNGQLLSDSGTRVQLSRADRLGLNELSLVAVDNAGIETTARYVPPPE